ncbi:MAG TPA: hypothetical protein VMU93_00270 [Caulobacteraceae bacterium]|nr:hypothetical protein [Caulobacteraceae bacterium]
MKTYKILVHERRREEPITLVAELSCDQRAREFARDRLASSTRYEFVEVWDGATRLCRFGAVRQAA